MTGSRAGLLWPLPVDYPWTHKDTLTFPANPSSANVATPQERLRTSHSSCSLFCKPSDDGSSELATSSLTVLPSWLGDVVIPMRRLGTLPLSILVLCCWATGYIPSSVAALA